MKTMARLAAVWMVVLWSAACSNQAISSPNQTEHKNVNNPNQPECPPLAQPGIEPEGADSEEDQVSEGITDPPEKEKIQAKLVDYEGPVEHIFFHPLIAYPKLAFDGDAMAQGV